MAQKVLIKELHHSYEISHSNKSFEDALKYLYNSGSLQKKLADVDNADDFLGGIKGSLELLQLRKDYLQSALGLSDKQLADFDAKLSPEDFEYACQRVAMLVQGSKPEDVEKAIYDLKSAIKGETYDATGKEEGQKSSK